MLSSVVSSGKVFRSHNNVKAEISDKDILSALFYQQAVSAAYPANPVPEPELSDKKRTTVYEQAFKAAYNIGFNKRRVAESVKKLLLDRKEDKETQDNLGILSTAIIARLTSQVPTTSKVPTVSAPAMPA